MKLQKRHGTTALSNQKIGWGIKRNDNHIQPDLGSKNKELIEKYNGIAMGNNESKTIYLTFDLGYEAGYTENILNVLKEKEVPATFFITAHYLNTASDLVERMINEGHIVGNHTVNHKSMPDLSEDEIKSELMTLNQSVYEKFGYEMKYMRPPKGEFSERTLSITESLGFKTVMWSFAYVDWNEDSQPSKTDAINKIISNLHNGEVMLLHATSKTNSEIMGELIDNIKSEGYEIKSLEEFR
jgi:peptidoglycan-N-acetylmuramic acid deacetylase